MHFGLNLEIPMNPKKEGYDWNPNFEIPKSALRLVHLGLEFGIKLDLPAVERGDRTSNCPQRCKITYDVRACPLLLFSLHEKTPEDIASSIARHFDELADYIDRKAMRSIQIEMFSKAGMLERAK